MLLIYCICITTLFSALSSLSFYHGTHNKEGSETLLILNLLTVVLMKINQITQSAD